MSEDGTAEASETGARTALVLDYLPRGRSDDDRPQYQKSPLAHVLGTRDFLLYELVLAAGEAVSIGDEVSVDPPENPIEEVRRIAYDDLSGGVSSRWGKTTTMPRSRKEWAARSAIPI